ncbi:MAG TPA: hypothetical protein VH280_19045 [Verrucomicrobiae bacterium]|jgi:hypothetical protein|nr:hypothetical protein [Verrucomicrobiae bacterium]
MNFPQFWARGSKGDFICWRWSFQSVAEAQTLANQAVETLAAMIRAGKYPPKYGGYYPNRPFREEILQEFKNEAGEIVAVITRNSYGCEVLNTARLMFVDIDLPEPKAPGLFKRLFGKPDVAPPHNPQTEAIARIESWSRAHPEWGWRIYRTRAGLRLLATQSLIDADSDLVESIFEALGADPLYRKLCKAQKCFRARLTPKPWRCGVSGKPERWPYLDAKAERKFQKWNAHYRSSCGGVAVCEFLSRIGNPEVHLDIQSLLAIHDDISRAESKLPLA